MTLLWPGFLVQKITTRQPTDDMIEVAIVSMEQALAADNEAIPAGSATMPRDPMVLPGTAGAAGEAAAPVTIDPPLPGA